MKKLLIAFAMVLPLIAFGQHKTSLGISVANEYCDSPDDTPYLSYGINIEHQFAKHWGIETGYQFCRLSNYSNLTATKYNSIPLGMKFYNKIVNISGGVNFNYFKEYQFPALVGGTLYVPNINWLGLHARISKDISLSNKLIFEPGAQLNYDSDTFGPTYGLSLRLKYSL